MTNQTYTQSEQNESAEALVKAYQYYISGLYLALMQSDPKKPQRPIAASPQELINLKNMQSLLPAAYRKPTPDFRLVTLGGRHPYLTNCGVMTRWLGIEESVVRFEPSFEEARRVFEQNENNGLLLVPSRHRLFAELQDSPYPCTSFSAPISEILLLGKDPKLACPSKLYVESVISYGATQNLLQFSVPEVTPIRFDTLCQSTADAMERFLESKTKNQLCITTMQSYKHAESAGEELFIWDILSPKKEITWGLFMKTEAEK